MYQSKKNNTTQCNSPQGRLLDSIDSPADFRNFALDKLQILAGELRETIIDTVSVNGGHLAPCLGVVELTIALHKVFDTPKDKIVWDVGHQTYAHKLLTGRVKEFATLRQYKGLSGFPKRSESKYDAFETGHSSTSISAATGLAMANNLTGGNSKTIAVIGDGAMTAGLAFEGLNQAGHLDRDLIVVLNDNEMSISPNVGALSNFLSRKLAGKTMRRVKEHLIEKLGEFETGESILTILRRSEESFKSFFTPGMLFEAFKFNYVGPIDGHDLPELLKTLETVRDISQGPVLVHVLTKKGKGYPPAEKNPGQFHGLGPFDKESGTPLSKTNTPSYTAIFGKTICAMAEHDKSIVAIAAAMASGTGLGDFGKTFPERFFDVGIAEQHAVTFAAGLAEGGMRPVVAVYSTFFQRAYDQIVHDVCIPNLPVTLAIDRAGVVGDDGPTHHGVFDLAYLRAIPNMVVFAPKDENELQHAIFTAVNTDSPTAIRYPRGTGVGVELDKNLHMLEIGKGEILRKGNDLLLLPVGNRIQAALEAAETLTQELGISVAVINPRFVKPLDTELICHWAQHCKKIITVEDGVLHGGFGSAVLEMLSGKGIHNTIAKLLGYRDQFMEQGTQPLLWRDGGIDAESIIFAGKEISQL